MLEKLEGLPANVMGVRATGTVTKADYVEVLDPMIERARAEGRRIRFLYQFAPGFEGFSGGGALEDARIGLSAMALFEGIAVVTDVEWLRKSIGLARLMIPCPVRVYANAEFDEAAAWLAGLPPTSVVPHRLIEDVGVLVIEPKDPLRASDFDAVAHTVDPWIAAHGELHGLVLHAIAFPGWENITSFVRHMQFLRDHYRKIRKVAIVADSKIAAILPRIAEHFATADVRHYDYDQLDAAIAWAGADERSKGAAE